jgi:hypothetical protein
VAGLRRRYTPGRQPVCPLTSLIGPGSEGAQQTTPEQD